MGTVSHPSGLLREPQRNEKGNIPMARGEHRHGTTDAPEAVAPDQAAVCEVSDKRLLELVEARRLLPYRLSWEIYDQESGNILRKDRFYELPSGAFKSFDWARTEQRCVSAKLFRRGAPEHTWVMLGSFVNQPLRAALGGAEAIEQ